MRKNKSNFLDYEVTPTKDRRILRLDRILCRL
jgi:hypothetical protein